MRVRKKVKAAGIAGAIATVMFGVCKRLGLDVETQVFGLFAISDAVVAAAAFIAGYMKTEDA